LSETLSCVYLLTHSVSLVVVPVVVIISTDSYHNGGCDVTLLLLGTTVLCRKIMWILHGISLNSVAYHGKWPLILR